MGFGLLQMRNTYPGKGKGQKDLVATLGPLLV